MVYGRIADPDGEFFVRRVGERRAQGLGFRFLGTPRGSSCSNFVVL